MIPELLGIYAAVLGIKALRGEELIPLPWKRVIYQNDQPLCPLQRTAATRQFVVTQTLNSNTANAVCVREIPSLQHIDHKTICDDEIYALFCNIPIKASTGIGDRNGLESLLKELGEELHAGDVLYFVVGRYAHHGDVHRDESWIKKQLCFGEKVLGGFYDRCEYRGAWVSYDGLNPLTIGEFEEMFAPISESGSVNVLYFDTCFGGDFARRMGKGNNIAISTARPRKIIRGRQIPELFFNKNTAEYFTQDLFLGRTVLDAFKSAPYSCDYAGLPPRILIHQPRMYVGNVDPATVYFK